MPSRHRASSRVRYSSFPLADSVVLSDSLPTREAMSKGLQKARGHGCRGDAAGRRAGTRGHAGMRGATRARCASFGRRVSGASPSTPISGCNSERRVRVFGLVGSELACFRSRLSTADLRIPGRYRPFTPRSQPVPSGSGVTGEVTATRRKGDLQMS